MTATTTGRRVALWPTGGELVDAGFLVALTTIALLGFRLTYGSAAYLVVAGSALVLGILLAYVVGRLRLPLLALAAVTVVVFFLLGGLATNQAGALPTAGTVSALGRTTVRGWMDLLTTSVPVGDAGNLMALPYLLGLAAGVTGFVCARWTTRVSLPLVPPAVVLVLGIVFGTAQPAALVAQGGGFVGLALLWAALRRDRSRPGRLTAAAWRSSRVVASTLTVAAVSAVGVLVGPHVPFAHAHERVIARTYVTPPFDPSAYPSPLAGFRKYIKKGPLYDKTLLQVAGAPDATHLRIAVMTGYDGLVWAVTGSDTELFAKVGPTVPNAPSGPRSTITVTAAPAYGDVWVPDTSHTAGITFAGPRAVELTQQFRYDASSQSGVQPSGLRDGDVARLSVVSPPPPPTSGAAGGTPVIPADTIAWITPTATQWAGPAVDDWSKLQSIATHMLNEGRYSDGSSVGETQYHAGHGVGSLRTFLAAPQLVGDDEQYAATFALMSNALGIPARVVLGAVVPSSGVVQGKDVHAWIEVQIAGSGWVPIYSDAFVPPVAKKPDAEQKQVNGAAQHAQVPPPVAARSKNDIQSPDDSDTKTDQRKDNKATAKPTVVKPPLVPKAVRHVLVFVLPPIALLIAFLLLVVALKAWRRRRRRCRGGPTTRIAGGWADLLACATDLGVHVPARRTRAEQAAVLGVAPAHPLARSADAAVFGPGDPDGDDVARYWREIAAARRALRRQSRRTRRLRAMVTTRSLRRSQRRDAPRANGRRR